VGATKVLGLLPHYIAYRASNFLAWPDGRGRYYQPLKLIRAFDLLSVYWAKYESIAAKEQHEQMAREWRLRAKTTHTPRGPKVR